jgi:iron complex outermembrane receptor protein
MFKRTEVSTALAIAFGGALAITALPGVAQQQLEKVEITGSAIKRIDAETALPVQVITREEIARTGVTSTEQLLKSVSAISSLGGVENATGAGTSTGGLSSISLRGLGDERTLVLVNGRRIAAFAGGDGSEVNVNNIPLSAIERVEILKDGASALYGSDAVAGVVNFILTRNFTGLELGVSHGEPTRNGGGKNNKVFATAGFGDLSKDRFNVTASLGIEKESALFAKDRAFASTGNVFPFITSGATGQGNIEGAYTPGTGAPSSGETGVAQPGFGTSPGVGYGNPLAALGGGCESINMFNAGNTNKGSPFCAFDSAPFVGLTPDRDLSTLTLNGVFNLSDQVQLFGDLLRSESTIIQQFQASPLRRSFMQTDSLFAARGVDPVLLIRPNNPNYQTAVDYLTAMEAANPGQGFAALIGQPLAVTARVFDFGDRTNKDVSEQTRLVGGIKGTWNDKDYEFAYSRNENKLSGTVPNGYFSQVAFAEVVNRPDSDYNPWSLTQSDTFNQRLAEANVKYTGATLNAESTADGLDGRVSGEWFAMPAGTAMYAVGSQGRIEKLKLSPSAALLGGDVAGLGGATLPVDEERKIASVFGEMTLPLLKELEATGSVRWDKYSGVGNSSTYKASLRYQPNKVILVRSAIGSGFRAPTLIELFEPQVTGTSEQFDDPATGQTDVQTQSITGGNPALQPEKSRQRSFGVVVAPASNFQFSVDVFQIRIDDIIAEPSTQEIVSRFRAGDPAYAGLVVVDPTTNAIERVSVVSANTGNATVRGADVGAAFRQDFGVGRLDLAFNGTYMDKFDQTSPSGAISRKVGTLIEDDGSPVLGAQDGGVVLQWKYQLSGTWTTGPWATTLALNFADDYQAGLGLLDQPNRIPDSYIYDANVSYSGIKNLRVNVGVKNLFDKDPPIFTPVSNQFQAGYDITQYDPRARFMYVTAAYKFF